MMNGSDLNTELGKAGVTMIFLLAHRVCNLYLVEGRASSVCKSQILLYTECYELLVNSENPVLGDHRDKKII